jgi:hypothetical protein
MKKLIQFERLPAHRARGAETRFLLFAAPWCIGLPFFLHGPLWMRIGISVLTAAVTGFFSLVAWDNFWHRRELRQKAWEEWIDRATRIARQYDITIVDDHPVWREYFRSRMLPEDAVAVHRAAVALDDAIAREASLREGRE